MYEIIHIWKNVEGSTQNVGGKILEMVGKNAGSNRQNK